MLPAAFLTLHKLCHNLKQKEIPRIINSLHVPGDEIRGSPGLVEQSYLESVGRRDSPACGRFQYMRFDTGNYCLEEGFLREKKINDFPVGL